jgi:prepilin-type N-terminal cleavage/methylation domain-containing protein
VKTTRAFTLIEVMVVLSILAIIAILAYNFFGSTMKQAAVSSQATQIYRDMLAIDTAYNLAAMKTGAHWEVSAPAVTPITNISTIIDDGGLRVVPTPPQNAYDPDEYFTWGYEYGLLGNNVWDFGGPSTAKDLTIALFGVTRDVCQELNTKYSSVGATMPTTYAKDVAFFCCENGPGSNIYQVNLVTLLR